MTRDEAINLAKIYDGIYPSDLIPLYTNVRNVKEFDSVLDKWANKDLFRK